MTVIYIEYFLKIMILAAPVYILVRWMVLKYQRKGNRTHRVDIKREMFMGIFFLYLAGILVMTLVMDAEYGSLRGMMQSAKERLISGEGINLVPFRTISRFLGRSTNRDIFLINIVGNIVMFAPWGVGLATLWKGKRKMPRVLLGSAFLPVFIETGQLFVGRSVDIDDWILNFIGSLLGGLLFI